MPRARGGGEGSGATELSLDGAAYTAVQHFLDEMEDHHTVLDKAEGTHDLSFLLKKKTKLYLSVCWTQSRRKGKQVLKQEKARGC